MEISALNQKSMAEVEILQPGLFSTIQDLGRFGYMHFGVPTSGAMDMQAAALANALLQNEKDAAVLEVTQLGPKMTFSAPTTVVITGATLSPTLDGVAMSNNKVYKVKKGSLLSFGKRILGCRAYLAIKGGFNTGIVLNSRSWYAPITEKSRLEKGMLLPYNSFSEADETGYSSVKQYDYFRESVLDVFPGPEYHRLSDIQKKRLQKWHFSIGRNSNRMGIQLEEIFENNLESILTGPVVPGTVQLTPGGRLIVLMRDAQTTGGYPRILQLSEKAINVLSQKIQGDGFQFRLINFRDR